VDRSQARKKFLGISVRMVKFGVVGIWGRLRGIGIFGGSEGRMSLVFDRVVSLLVLGIRHPGSFLSLQISISLVGAHMFSSSGVSETPQKNSSPNDVYEDIR
jgi:hypothetical protein